jgi:drug/metabolite transporter (DMT)-like permease
MDQPSQSRAIVLLVIAAVLWSLGGLFIKSVDWNAFGIAGGRSVIAAAAIWALSPKLKLTWSRWQIIGAVAYAGTVLLFVIANRMTTAANAILLQYTAPIYVLLLGPWLLKERSRPLDWVAMAAVFGGMALFFVDDLKPGQMAGNLAAIGSGVAFAFLAIALRHQRRASAIESVFLGNLLCAVVALPFATWPGPGALDWGILAALGIVQLAIPYILYVRAIRRVTALEATLIPVIEPLLNPLWVLLLLGERPSPLALVGGAVVLLAVTMRALWQIGSPSQPPSEAQQRGSKI